MPQRSYIICGTPRSGSTMLCDLLTDTGLAGRPKSYYRRQSVPSYAAKFGIDHRSPDGNTAFERAYLDAVIKAGTGTTGTFGMRLMAENASELFAQLKRLFPDQADDAARMGAAFHEPVYIHLARIDKVGQAVSLLKANQTGLWHVTVDGSERERTDPPRPAAYNADRLAEHVASLKQGDCFWEQWFDRHGIGPVRMTYESLVADPQANLARVLDALGLPSAIAKTIAPRTGRLADQESAKWASRYRAENGLPPA